MEILVESSDIQRLSYNGKEIILVGTSHVSKESVALVKQVIETEKPDTVCVELCESRYKSIMDRDGWRNMDIVKVIREEKTFLLLTNLLLASFQKKIAADMGIQPGQEMVTAIQTGENIGAKIIPSDREIQITLSKTWRVVGLWEKFKIFFELIMTALMDTPEITEEDIEKMKEQDVLQSILGEVEKSHPVIRAVLIDERDQYLTHMITQAPGNKIVAVVGAGHVPGINMYWGQDIDMDKLVMIPPKGWFGKIVKWGLSLSMIAFIISGFFLGGKNVGTEMLVWWSLATGIFAGIGAIIALGHPLSILSAILSAPLIGIHPGWVAGLVEAIIRKPKVMDIENLQTDILSVKGFWKNQVTRILLVVMFANIGGRIGVFLAFTKFIKFISIFGKGIS